MRLRLSSGQEAIIKLQSIHHSSSSTAPLEWASFTGINDYPNLSTISEIFPL